jgi:hypothetical protein
MSKSLLMDEACRIGNTENLSGMERTEYYTCKVCMIEVTVFPTKDSEWYSENVLSIHVKNC